MGNMIASAGRRGLTTSPRRVRRIVWFALAIAAASSAIGAEFNIVDYGAHIGDRLQTKSIQAAIDACHAAGGGEVVVPEGVFRTGGIELKSGVALHLLDGAILEGSRDPEDYRYPAEPRRWMRSLIRADGARDIAIVGGRHSAIDGRNCYDPEGEEAYRGPHAIRFTGCTNVSLKGYSIRDSANWAHALFQCAKVDVRNVRVYGGHDGLDVHCCSDVRIVESEFHTGDDCIAGFGNCGVTVSNCVLDCSCNAVRFGGTDCLFVGCRMTHPATFGHRWGLSAEEKRLAVTHGEAVRHGGQMFSYYCDRRWGDDLPRPGNIVFRDCVFDRPSRLFVMSFDGRNQWCCNKPLASIAFERCEVLGVGCVASIYGGAEDPIDFVMRDCRVTPAKGKEGAPPISAYNFKRILLDGVRFEGYRGRPCVVKRSEGEVLARGGTEVDMAFRPDPKDEVYTFEKALGLVDKMAADDAAFAEWLKANSARGDAWGDLAAVWGGSRTAEEMRAVGKSMRGRYGYFYRNGRVATLVSDGEWSDVPAGMFIYAISKYEPFVARVAATDYIRAGAHSPASVAGVRAALRRIMDGR